MRSSTKPSRTKLFLPLATLALAGAASAQTPAPKPAAQGPAAKPAAQSPAPQGPAAKPEAAPQKGAAVPKGDAAQQQLPWRLTVTKDTPAVVTLKAKDARLTEIAAELSKRLKTPVILSPLMQRQRVTIEFENVPLEGAVRVLAPQPYIDYEISGDGSAQPRPLGIFLYAFNETPPERDAVAKGSDEAILITGNTEEGTEEYEKQKEKEETPLAVKFERNLLSVRANKQPLAVVLYEIASKVDIPFEMKYESGDLVDVNFNNYTLEQAARALSPNIRLYQRVNLTNYEATPLRLLLVQPASSATIH